MTSLSDFSSSYPNMVSEETILYRILEYDVRSFSLVVQKSPTYNCKTHTSQANPLPVSFYWATNPKCGMPLTYQVLG